MKVNVHGLVFVGFAAAILAGAAHATGENIVTSQAYTEATYQHKLGGDSNGIVKAGSTAGSVTYVDIADAATDITGLTNDSSAADKGALTTAEAVKGAIDQVNQTATNAQVKSTADFQLGGAQGVWKTVEAGNYITAPSAGVAQNSAKFDIDTTKITSSSELTNNGTKLAREGDVKGYVDGKIGGSVNSSNTTQAPTGATIAAAIDDALTTDDHATYQTYSETAQLVSNGAGGWEALTKDTTVAQDSANPVTSGAVYNALHGNGTTDLGYERVENKASAIIVSGEGANITSTDEYASTKAVYDYVESKTGANIIASTVTDGDTTHAPSGDAVHDYVADQLTNGGTNGHGYQEKSTALSVGGSNGSWVAAASSVTNDANTVPTTAAVYSYVQSQTGGVVIPTQNSNICGANNYAPCALVYEASGPHWRTMATDQHAGGVCGDAGDANCDGQAD